jgi:DNA-binding beta-propeller fold protein YncE
VNIDATISGGRALATARALLWLLLPVLVALILAAVATDANAATVIAPTGESAGKVQNPRGLAVDSETGRLYVADRANHRIDVFDSAGHFAMAFGWGVADGKAEPETCGPEASPPTATCRKGLEGGGAGEFQNPTDVAVDNSSSSSSHHDVYVVETRSAEGLERGVGARVQKFTPEGQFLLAWGGGVITASAVGTGNLTTGSTEITGVQTQERSFELGQLITASGKIPAGTRIVGLGSGTITLSQPASASGSSVPIEVAAGPGDVPVNEIQETIQPTTDSLIFTFQTPNPSPTQASVTVAMPAAAAEVQAKLESLSSIGTGGVSVSGPVGGPFKFEFKGRLADTDVAPLWIRFVHGGGGAAVYTARNGHSAAEICTAAIASSCSGAQQGNGPGQFGEPGDVQVAVGPDGTVYVSDVAHTLLDLESSPGRARVQKFDPDGTFVEELTLPQGVAPADDLAVGAGGDLYVAAGGLGARKYGPIGNLLETLSGTLSGVSSIGLDSAGDVFVTKEIGQKGREVAEFDPSGTQIRAFGYGELVNGIPPTIAPYSGPAGELYATVDPTFGGAGEVIDLSFPPPGPLLFPEPCTPSFVGNNRATLHAYINPDGKPTTYHFEYITEADYLADGGSFGAGTVSTPESTSIGSDFTLHEVEDTVTPLVPETAYRCRVVAQNPDASGITGQTGAFTTKKALEIEGTWVSEVGSDHATLDASVDPLGIPATGYFEYVDAATYEQDVAELGPGYGFDHAHRAPPVGEEPLDLGSAEEPTAVGLAVTGLQPSTAYRYRFVATDLLIEPEGRSFTSQTKSFATFATGAGSLPDGRAWEMVSPDEKNGAEVAVPWAAGGLFQRNEVVPRIEAAAGSGEAVTYTSWTSFGEAAGAPGTSQYLSKRTGQGWVTENISPGGRQFQGLNPAYRGFSPDLRFAAVLGFEPPLTADAQPGFENMYFRDDDSGDLSALTKEPIGFTPPSSGGQGPRRFCTTYAGATTDGSHAFFAADGAMGGAPGGAGFSLYEWSPDAPLGLVSILPDETPAPPAPKTHFGGEATTAQECWMDQGPMRNAVSADGSVAFWTYGGTYQGTAEPLFARIDGTRTVELDAKETGATGPSGQGQFWAATADGSRAFFTAPGRLTSKAHAAGQLYMYETEAGTITDLTPGSVAPEIGGVIGASEDGDTVYFVGTGALTGTQQDSAGEEAKAGVPNLYSWREGEGLRFIANLSGLDGSDSEQPSGATARLTPDGDQLAFLSAETEALSGYDNIKFPAGGCQPGVGFSEYVKESDPHCSEVYLYDAESHDLDCVSCNPSGARPTGRATLPAWTNPFEGPRYLSDDGDRLFFESPDSLTAGDVNGERDVYEFERPGAGSCTSQSPSFVEATDGCLSLISNGRYEGESFLIDASADGRDVFFTTRAPLVGWDGNGDFDVYDAREGGGLPGPPTSQTCEGEACKPPASSAPSAPTASTSNFQGLGNPKPSKPSKPRKHPKKHHRHKGHGAKKRPAGHKRKAGR